MVKNNFFKKAFTMLEVLFVTAILVVVISVGYYFLKDFKLAIDFDPFVNYDNVKIELCETPERKIIKNNSCHGFKITQLNFGNTGFTYNSFKNSGIGIGDENENNDKTDKIDLTKYENKNFEYNTIPRTLYQFYSALSGYNAEHGCDIDGVNGNKNVIYKINGMYFTCNFDKIQYLKVPNLGIKIIDGFLYVK